MLSVYKFITSFVSDRLGLPAELQIGLSYTQLYDDVDVGFVCGLPYIQLTQRGELPVEPLAAPVLGESGTGVNQSIFRMSSFGVTARSARLRSFAVGPGATTKRSRNRATASRGITLFNSARRPASSAR